VVAKRQADPSFLSAGLLSIRLCAGVESEAWELVGVLKGRVCRYGSFKFLVRFLRLLGIPSIAFYRA
jgi:hypothetical protein